MSASTFRRHRDQRARVALDAVARGKGFASAKEFEDSVVASCVELLRADARSVEVGSDLVHLYGRIVREARAKGISVGFDGVRVSRYQ